MAWTRVPFKKLYMRWSGVEYEINGLEEPIIYQGAINELANYSGSRVHYEYRRRRGTEYDDFVAMYNSLNGGNGFDFYHFIADLMAVGSAITIYKTSYADGGDNQISLYLYKQSNSQIQVGFRYGTTWTGTPNASDSIVYFSPALEGNTHPSTIVNPSFNIGFITDGTDYNIYTVQCAGSDSGYDMYYDDNYYNFDIISNVAANKGISIMIKYLITDNVPPPPSEDPYDAGGTSTVDPQGTGDFDDSSDAITAPAMTSLSPIDADFIKLYKIDKANLTAFAQYLFSASFTTNLEKMWNSVSEAILCLNLLPFTPAGTASTATDIIFDSSDSNADGYLITQQYEELDFGSVTISEFYGSCLDYSPYTSLQLSLPFGQTVNLDPDEFMGRSVGVKCRVDVYTGAGLYLIDNGTSVLMQVPVTLANPLPWSAKDYSAVMSAVANTAITVGGALAVLATGGVGTPAAIAIAGGVAANTANNVMQAKPHYQHGGSAGMGTGIFGIQKPYLIIKRPRQCLPVDNNKYQGYPSMATLGLGSLKGFTKVLQIHLDNLPATDAEKKELETILKGGVWF